MPRYYPAALRIEERACVVVGGGGVAARRAAGLAEAGARVTVVSPEACESVQGMAQEGAITWRAEPYRRACLHGAFLVVAAAGDATVNAAVAADARAAGILCNDADEPERGDLIVPTVVRRGDLMLSVTAGGLSPFLSARIRSELERAYGPEYAEYVALLGEVRAALMGHAGDHEGRREALRALAHDETILPLIREGRTDEARARAFSCISSSLA